MDTCFLNARMAQSGGESAGSREDWKNLQNASGQCAGVQVFRKKNQKSTDPFLANLGFEQTLKLTLKPLT